MKGRKVFDVEEWSRKRISKMLKTENGNKPEKLK